MKQNKLISLLFLFKSIIGFSQNLQGTAYYTYKEKIPDFDIKDKVQKDALMAILEQESEKTYILKFSRANSLYYEQEQIDLNPAKKVSTTRVDSQDGRIYKDIKHGVYRNQTELFGKLFLIEDTIPSESWQLKEETKNIGNYQCHRAILKKPRRQKQEKENSVINYIRNKEGKEDDNFRIIEAWYTPEIPTSNGPQLYSGLPGLILALSYDNITILCSKISVRIGEKTTTISKFIRKPEKGTQVNKREFDSIKDYKLKELKSLYRPRE